MNQTELHREEDEVRLSLRANLTDATALEVARHIVRKMEREADDETLEYDFHVQHGQMHVTEQFAEKNCWFKFDTSKDSILHDIKKVMFEADCNTPELEFIDGYVRKVCDAVISLREEVERVLCKVMFRGKPVPIRLERVTNFEVIDFSDVRAEENYQLLVEKEVPRGVLEEYGAGSISAELFRIHEETGKGFNAIIREKKAAGDPNYQYVTGAVTKKMLWECQIDMFVNFLAVEPPLAPPQSPPAENISE